MVMVRPAMSSGFVALFLAASGFPLSTFTQQRDGGGVHGHYFSRDLSQKLLQFLRQALRVFPGLAFFFRGDRFFLGVQGERGQTQE